jgi:hypothetical protein
MDTPSQHALIAPFEIGRTYWLPSYSPRLVVEPCPVCAGSKHVTVLAPAEQFIVDCDGCGLGYLGPQGTVNVYHYEPYAAPFVIGKVVRVEGEQWTVESMARAQAVFDTLCETQPEALEKSKAAYLAQEERNADSRRHRRKGVSKAAWTVRYHGDAIKKLERELAFHRGKLGLLKGEQK